MSMKFKVFFVTILMGASAYSAHFFTLNSALKRIDVAAQKTVINNETQSIIFTETYPDELKMQTVLVNDDIREEDNKGITEKQRPVRLSHLDEIITKSSDGYTLFDSGSIDKLSLSDTRELLSSLTDKMTDIDSQSTLDSLNDVVAKIAYLNASPGLFVDSTSCSDKICGLLLSGQEQNVLLQELNAVTSSLELKGKLQGGTLRVFKEDGMYFGLMISAIGKEPIKIR
ncbi:hypothetical protein LZP73_18215 [Shewanella sp. AS16]|uniref:hypothetical protein n=1 Tax=Shewanella sp. AS16 TaxID=2907625 RepID=UPI001F205D91|nr:hypothetical protein [Shewanella sp. AS16]MCE9688114.1 hypothetical protein [Shewanella sp. AS16]